MMTTLLGAHMCCPKLGNPSFFVEFILTFFDFLLLLGIPSFLVYCKFGIILWVLGHFIVLFILGFVDLFLEYFKM